MPDPAEVPTTAIEEPAEPRRLLGFIVLPDNLLPRVAIALGLFVVLAYFLVQR